MTVITWNGQVSLCPTNRHEQTDSQLSKVRGQQAFINHYCINCLPSRRGGVLECDDDGPAGFSPNLLEGCVERVLGCCFTLSSWSLGVNTAHRPHRCVLLFFSFPFFFQPELLRWRLAYIVPVAVWEAAQQEDWSSGREAQLSGDSGVRLGGGGTMTPRAQPAGAPACLRTRTHTHTDLSHECFSVWMETLQQCRGAKNHESGNISTNKSFVNFLFLELLRPAVGICLCYHNWHRSSWWQHVKVIMTTWWMCFTLTVCLQPLSELHSLSFFGKWVKMISSLNLPAVMSHGALSHGDLTGCSDNKPSQVLVPPIENAVFLSSLNMRKVKQQIRKRKLSFCSESAVWLFFLMLLLMLLLIFLCTAASLESRMKTTDAISTVSPFCTSCMRNKLCHPIIN